MSRHRVALFSLILALSLSLGLSSLRPDLAAQASEPTGGAKPRPTLAARSPGWRLATSPRSPGAAAPSARHSAATQTIVNQTWEGISELPAGWRTADENGITVGGQIYWAIRGAPCWSSSAPGAVAATAGGQNGVLDCGEAYPNVVDSSLVYGPFSLANATSAALSVNLYFDTEPGYDTLTVKVSLDGGSTFVPLAEPLSGPVGPAS